MSSAKTLKTIHEGPVPDRSDFSTLDTIGYIWQSLGLPEHALCSLDLDHDEYDYNSSFKIGHIAQSTIALSALGAALIHSLRQSTTVPSVSISLRHALLEFKTESFFTIDGKAPPSSWGPIGGLHATADGHIRIHDSFPNHRKGALRILGLNELVSREDVSKEVLKWKKLELEDAGYRNKCAMYALRSYEEWDSTPHASAVSNFPILVEKLSEEGPNGIPADMHQKADRCLQGLRVLELSRVIAAPVAGKTLAAHGADVLWVTSPKLPDLPSLDRNLSRGKRTIQLDLDTPAACETMKNLVRDCDVFIQGYRPESLAMKGFGPDDLIKLKPGLIYANLSAFGPSGQWSDRRGFDSLVQTCSGMNVSEAEHFGEGAPARPMPCQALDHGGGYLLATGIMAALYKRSVEGGNWQVHVSLAGVMKYLRSLGQRTGPYNFRDPMDGVPDGYFQEQDSSFGWCRGLKHAPVIEGAMPGFEHPPRPLGSDKAAWL